MKLRLIKLLIWLLIKLDYNFYPVNLELVLFAKAIVPEVGKTKHSGHYKAAIAFKAIKQTAPGYSSNDYKIALELAYRELGKELKHVPKL